jgi:hypothetical protein
MNFHAMENALVPRFGHAPEASLHLVMICFADHQCTNIPPRQACKVLPCSDTMRRTILVELLSLGLPVTMAQQVYRAA